ncbi:methyltransferase domain-containing protein [Chthonobacter rhizosphaerae]|uniref:methyltransferase domain-containing protein n=1 Tax=Chthonobacter rhizosphaerae TaxID=2735553 RepID=UPI0015EF8F5D|nr:methyltransferase domain-containing protein [Chthonobacter rhizosphaerae]
MSPLALSSGDLLADRRYDYARLYAGEGDHAAAADLFAQTLERVPGWLPALIGLADARAAVGDGPGAAEALKAALSADPDDLFGAALRLAALGRAPVPETPPEAYVRGLFDDYADRFETALVETLKYRVPWRLGSLLADRRPAGVTAPAFGRVLDLGCGTGLMGEVLRARCVHLEGVDLSPEMLERAAGKQVYDALAVGDVAAHLEASETPLDLVTAADVFVYVGTLETVFAAVAARLAPDGLFAFSVEAADAGDVVLRDSLRYAHGEGYLRRLADEAGFVVLDLRRETLREDRSAPVEGFLVVLGRPAARDGRVPAAGDIPVEGAGDLRAE